MEFIIGYRQKAQRSWRSILGRVALVYAIIGGGVVLSLGYLRWSTNRHWQDFAETSQVAGEPLTFAEIEDLRSTIPERQNGARVIERLGNELAAIEDARMDELIWRQVTAGTKWETKHSFIDFFQGIPRLIIAPTRDFTEEHSETLIQLARLHAVESGRFDLDLQVNPLETEFPHHDWLRGASYLLSLGGAIYLIDGEIELAGQAVELHLKLANMIHDEPTLLSHLVRLSNDVAGLSLLQDTLRVGELSPELLERLYEAVADRASSATMKWALWGERAFYLELLEMPVSNLAVYAESFLDQGEASDYTSLSWALAPLFRAHQLRAAHHMASVIAVADDAHALIDAARVYETSVESDSQIYFLLKVMPPLERAIGLHAFYSGYLRSAQAALAAERFRLDTGRLPTAPEDLLPNFLDQWPTDPFDGQPMRFATTCEGVVIYSIHYDFHDDGGSVTPIDGEQRPRDWGFRLFHAEERGLLIIEDMPEAAEQQAKN